MRKILQLSSVLCVLFLLVAVAGCGSAGYSSGSATYYNLKVG